MSLKTSTSQHVTHLHIHNSKGQNLNLISCHFFSPLYFHQKIYHFLPPFPPFSPSSSQSTTTTTAIIINQQLPTTKNYKNRTTAATAKVNERRKISIWERSANNDLQKLRWHERRRNISSIRSQPQQPGEMATNVNRLHQPPSHNPHPHITPHHSPNPLKLPLQPLLPHNLQPPILQPHQTRMSNMTMRDRVGV